ncbi:MAG: hypothetical protein M1816_002876 [Peltula sp. TS41687]|nr:MAG: hypothetical protein M1816_002876 [Peltula sp. TS41687]
MEKLKHLVHPGKEKDDAVLYGSGQSSDPLHPGDSTTRPTGEGSHLGAATAGDHHTGHGTSGIGSTSTTTTPYSSSLANKLDPRVGDSDRDGSRTLGTTHHTTGAPGSTYGASGIDPTPTRGHGDPLPGNINKPLPHTPASFTGPPGTGATLGNLPDRTVGSGAGTTSHTGSSGLGQTAALGGLAGASHQHQHQAESYGSDPSLSGTGTTGHAGHSGSGHTGLLGGLAGASHHQHQHQSDPYGTDPSVRGAGTTGHTGRSSSGHTGVLGGLAGASHHQHQSDPYGTDPSLSGTGTTGHTGHSSSGHTGVLGGLTGASHHQHQHQSDPYRNDNSQVSSWTDAPSTQRAFPLSGGTTTGPNESGLGRSGQGPVPLGNVSSHHHDPVEAGIGGTSHGGLMHYYHISHDINPTNPDPAKVDPRIASLVQFGHTPPEAIKAAAAMPVAPMGVSVGTGYDNIAAGAPRAAGYDHSHNSSTGTSSTAGPHKSNLLNKIDPRVDSDGDGSRTFGSVPGTVGNFDQVNVGGAPHSSTTGLTRDGHDIVGRESDYSQATTGAGVAAGVGALGAGLHSHGTSHETGYGGPTTGPHSSNLANRLDPRVDQGSLSHHHPTGGIPTNTSTQAPTDTYSGTLGRGGDPASTGHHYGSAATAGSAATGGVAAYELGKHHHHAEPSSTTTGPLGSTQPYGTAPGSVPEYRTEKGDPHHSKDEKKQGGHGLLGFLHKDKHPDVEEQKPSHHYGRDTATAGGVAAAGVGAYELGKHHGEPSSTATGPLSSSTSPPYGSVTGSVPETSHTGHHLGRDTLGAGAVGAGAVGASELPRHEAERISEYRTEREDRQHYPTDKHHHKEDKHHHQEDKHHHKEEEKHGGGGGLLGFLHRDKDKHHDVAEEKPTHHGAGTGATAGAAGLGTAAAVYEHDDRPHKLHKEPPPELLARAQAQSAGDGNLTASEGRDHLVTEPHTGLKMDLSKGLGQGGTDGGPIAGYHKDPAHHQTGRID